MSRAVEHRCGIKGLEIIGLVGPARVEKGHSADENQVSNTSDPASIHPYRRARAPLLGARDDHAPILCYQAESDVPTRAVLRASNHAGSQANR